MRASSITTNKYDTRNFYKRIKSQMCKQISSKIFVVIKLHDLCSIVFSNEMHAMLNCVIM